MTPQVYGDISPRTAAHAVVQMLRRGLPHLVIEKFGQVYVMPTKSTKVAKFRRYNALALNTTPLVEGVTPSGKKLTVTDVTATLEQYGDYVPFSDVIEDTHEDPYLQQLTAVLGEQAAQSIETMRYGVIKAGTNRYFSAGSSRVDVDTPISLTLQRKATRALKRQNATMITSVVASTASFNVQPIEAAFIGLTHVDVENDIRNMSGYINPKNYGTSTPWENEIGSVEDVRYLRSTIFTSFPDAATSGTLGNNISTTGTYPDVYPVIIIAKDAFGIVPLKGKDSLGIIVKNPGSAGSADPLNQRGTAGWKTMQTCVILQDAWMVRLEVSATN